MSTYFVLVDTDRQEFIRTSEWRSNRVSTVTEATKFYDRESAEHLRDAHESYWGVELEIREVT